MRLVDRHIGISFLKLYLAASLGLVCAGLLLETAELPARAAGPAGRAGALLDLLWFIPPFYANFSPLAVLLAGCACFALMAKYRETQALVAAGFRPARVWLPAAVVGACLVIPPLIVGETFVPAALERKSAGREIDRPVMALPGIFISGERFNPEKLTFTGLTIVRFRQDGTIRETYLARSARITGDGSWEMTDGTLVVFAPEGLVTGRVDFEERRVAVSFAADETLALLRPLETLGSGQLRAYLRLLSQAGLDPPPVRTFYYSRYSYHFLNLVVTIFFLPLLFSRRLGRPALVTIALVTGFAAYWFFSFCLALGNRGVLSPAAAVTLPHLAAAGLAPFFLDAAGNRRLSRKFRRIRA